MISLRYHLVSIAAVFLALALGVLLGSGGVSERLLSAQAGRADGLDGQVQTLTAERDRLAAAQQAADGFAGRVGPAAVRGLLAGKTVAFVTVGRGSGRPGRDRQAARPVRGRGDRRAGPDRRPSATRRGPTSSAS